MNLMKFSKKRAVRFSKVFFLIAVISVTLGGCFENPSLPACRITSVLVEGNKVTITYEITDDGGSPIIHSGCAYSNIKSEPTISDPIIYGITGHKTESNYGEGDWYFRPFAFNAAGVAYGEPVLVKVGP